MQISPNLIGMRTMALIGETKEENMFFRKNKIFLLILNLLMACSNLFFIGCNRVCYRDRRRPLPERLREDFSRQASELTKNLKVTKNEIHHEDELVKLSILAEKITTASRCYSITTQDIVYIMKIRPWAADCHEYAYFFQEADTGVYGIVFRFDNFGFVRLAMAGSYIE